MFADPWPALSPTNSYMIPFVNRAFGFSSFLGVLYFASYYNKTETPGLVKMFTGNPGTVDLSITAPEPSVVTDEPEQQSIEESAGPLFVPEDIIEVEEKHFVAPLELIVLEKDHFDSLDKGNWVIISHFEYSKDSRSFMKYFMGFFEDLASRKTFDDLPLSFGVLNLAQFPEEAVRLGIGRVPSVHFLKAGRLVRAVYVETKADWKVLKKVVRRGAWHVEVPSSQSSYKRNRVSWYKLLEYKIALRIIKFYSHDQIKAVRWMQESPIRILGGVVGAGLLSLTHLKL